MHLICGSLTNAGGIELVYVGTKATITKDKVHRGCSGIGINLDYHNYLPHPLDHRMARHI